MATRLPKPRNRQGAEVLLTIAEMAQELRCSKAHVQNILLGKVKSLPPLPHAVLGRRKTVRRSDLDRWLLRITAA